MDLKQFSLAELGQLDGFITSILVAVRANHWQGAAGVCQTSKWYADRWKEQFDREVAPRWMSSYLQKWDFFRKSDNGYSFRPEALEILRDALRRVCRGAVAPIEPTRELDTEHMTMEEQAELVEAQMAIRGGTVQMSGAVVKLKGLMMRPNALLNPDKIEAAFAELETLLRDGRAHLSRVRTAS